MASLRDLDKSLTEAMKTYAPLTIINDHLLGGMKAVGELFGSGQMQLPFVLQSAAVMKKAVSFLEPHMEKSEAGASKKASIVLATVAGDVHDIGKNLVDIILSNNGFEIHNIGIKQPLQTILDAWRRTGADAIGMSGLLVKSVAVMEENLHEMNRLGITVPVILGGAALTRHYAESHLRNIYKGRFITAAMRSRACRCATRLHQAGSPPSTPRSTRAFPSARKSTRRSPRRARLLVTTRRRLN